MSTTDNIRAVVDQIEALIRQQPNEGVLPQAQVEALDVVYHALVFSRHPQGLELWRKALWQRQLSDDARQSLVQMLEHLTAAVTRGETQAASQVCNCLETYIEQILDGEERDSQAGLDMAKSGAAHG